MAARDLTAAVTTLDDFRSAGRTLYSLGLVKDAEGNLSVFDGEAITITAAGVSLAAIGQADLVSGPLLDDLGGASTDVEVHRRLYGERGPGAVAHAHPVGTVPEGGGPPGQHGVYAFGASLEEAVAETVRMARRGRGPG